MAGKKLAMKKGVASKNTTRNPLYVKIGKRIRQARLMARESNSRDLRFQPVDHMGNDRTTPKRQAALVTATHASGKPTCQQNSGDVVASDCHVCRPSIWGPSTGRK